MLIVTVTPDYFSNLAIIALLDELWLDCLRKRNYCVRATRTDIGCKLHFTAPKVASSLYLWYSSSLEHHFRSEWHCRLFLYFLNSVTITFHIPFTANYWLFSITNFQLTLFTTNTQSFYINTRHYLKDRMYNLHTNVTM